MGRFVNPDSSAFQVALNSRIYVDKTDLISMHDGERDEENWWYRSHQYDRFGSDRRMCKT